MAKQGGVVIGSDIGWSMWGSEGGVANQGGVVIRRDLGAWSKQWGWVRRGRGQSRGRCHQERFRGVVKAELQPMGRRLGQKGAWPSKGAGSSGAILGGQWGWGQKGAWPIKGAC